MMQALNKLLAPLRTRVANMVSRAVLSGIDDSTRMQLLQVGLLSEETRDGIERFQNYGFTSNPLTGAEAVVVFVGGRRDHGLAIAVDDRRYRLRNLESGEVAVYTDQGDSIVIRRGGTIEVTGATAVVLDAPSVELAQPAVDDAVKGTTYRTAEDVLFTALNTFCAAIVPGTGVAAPAKVAIAAAFTAFSAASSGYLSTKVKVG